MKDDRETRTCKCGATYSVWSISLLTRCRTCSELLNEEWCGSCGGTGKYITQIENGRPIGPGGICYRCDGKGYQTRTDAKRNHYYDSHIRGRKACG